MKDELKEMKTHRRVFDAEAGVLGLMAEVPMSEEDKKKAEALKVRRENEGRVKKAGEDAMRAERLQMKREATARLESKDPKKAKDGRKARKEKALANPKVLGPMPPPKL